MSKYRNYATRADEAAREAFKKITDASKKLADAEGKARAYPQRHGMVDADYAAKSARATADLAEAKQNYEQAKKELATLNTTLANIRAELAQALAKDNRADPAAVDAATMDLLKSGILNVEDYIGLLERHSDNATMTRIIRKYAVDAADQLTNTADRQKLKAIAMSTDHDNAILHNFDVIAEVCRRAEHNHGMIDHYEALTAEVVQNF